MVKRLLLEFVGVVWRVSVVGYMLLLVGCKTKTVVVPEVHYRDSVVLRLQRDSVYFRDSVFVNRWAQGDTVYIDKVKTTYLYKDRLRVDTLFVNKVDTVTVVQAVERSLRWYDKAARWIALVAIGGAAGIILFLFVRK